MHKKKRWAAFLLVLVLFFSFATQVYAMDSYHFLHSYQTKAGRIIVTMANVMREEGRLPNADEISVKLGGQTLTTSGVITVGDAKRPITFYCLVDISASIGVQEMNQSKQLLYAIADNLHDKDNMVIGLLGTDLKTTDFQSDKKELYKVIDGIKAESNYTALYDSVIKSIVALQTRSEVNDQKCLIIISDGEDDTVMGKTQAEALTAIGASRIPVFTVAMIPKYYSVNQQQAAKNFGALARQSVGGKDYVPAVNQLTAQDTAADIVEQMYSTLVLTVNAENYTEQSKDLLLLNIEINSGKALFRDSIELNASDLIPIEIQASEKAETEEAKTEEATQTEPDISEKSDPKEQADVSHLWMIAAGIFLLIALCIASVIVKKRHKPASDDPVRNKSVDETPDTEWVRRRKAAGSDIAQPPELVSTVHFIAIDHEKIHFDLRLPQNREVTLGRNSKANYILNAADGKLSSVHCRVTCMKDCLIVRDANSQNGTFVNGVPIKDMGAATIKNGDRIRMGSYEYRVKVDTN